MNSTLLGQIQLQDWITSAVWATNLQFVFFTDCNAQFCLLILTNFCVHGFYLQTLSHPKSFIPYTLTLFCRKLLLKNLQKREKKITETSCFFAEKENNCSWSFIFNTINTCLPLHQYMGLSWSYDSLLLFNRFSSQFIL